MSPSQIEELRAAVSYLSKRLDMEGGDWPGISVALPDGTYVWGLLPDDIYAALVVLIRLAAREPELDDELDEEGADE